MMAAKKKKPEEKGAGASGSTRSRKNDAKKELARSPKHSPILKGQTPEELIHELRVHQIEIETQAEELRMAHLALEESRDKYLDLYEFAPLGYLTLNDKARITDVNLTGATLLGVERDEIINHGLGLFITSGDLEEWSRYFAKVRQYVEKQICTLTLKRGDGSVFPARLESIRLPGSRKGTTTVRMVISDITDIRQAEEALRENEERLRTILHSIQTGIIVIDAHTHTILDANQKSLDMIGGTKETVLGTVCHNYICPAELGKCPITDLAQTIDNSERILISTQGKKIQILKSVIPTILSGKKVLIESFIDITERKRAEVELVSAHQRLQEAHRLAHIGTWDWIIDTDTVTWSEELYNIAGRDPSLPAPTYAEHPRVYTPASWDCLSSAVNRALTTGEPYNLELELVRQDGSIRWTNAFGGVKRDGNGKVIGLHGMLQDITDRKQAEEALRESEGKYRALVETTGTGFVISDDQGRVMDANLEYIQLTGHMSLEEIAGRNVIEWTAAYERDKNAEAVSQCMTDGYIRNLEIDYVNASGTIIPIEINATVLRSGDTVQILTLCRDITERKRAEVALQESEAFNRGLVENLPDYIVVYGTDGKILYVNPATERVLGYGTNEVVGTHVISYVAEECRDEATANIAARHTGREIPLYELDIVAQDGHRRSVIVKGTLIQYNNSPAMLMLLIDITERKRAEEALKKSTRLLNDTGEMAKVGGWELDLSTREISWTEEVGRIHGVEPGYKLNLEDAIKFYAPESRPAVEAAVKKAAETGEPYNLESLFIPLGSKDKIWVRSLGRSVYSDGKIVKLAGTFQNIDKYKKAEEALRETNEYLHKLIEFGNAPIIVWDPDFRITRFNHAFERMTGRTEQEVLGQPLGILFPKKTRAASRALIKKTLAGERWEAVEIPILASDGTIRTVLWNLANVLTAEGELISTIAQGVDITERKQAEDTIALTARKLTLMNDVTYQYIQNKVTGLRGYAELSKDAKTEAERLSFIEKEEHVLADIHHLIKDTQEYQEIGLLLPRWIAVEQSIRMAVSLVSPKQDISIESALHGLELYSDPLIEKIFANLIENAVLHGKTLTRITFSCKEMVDGLILICEDDGVGISPKDKVRLFDRLVGEKIRFGLFFIRECLVLSGMTIAETGEPGKGARFEIHIPSGMWRKKGASE